MAQPISDDEHIVEVRCPNAPSVLHFNIIDGDRIEVKCNNKRCTGGGQTVVLHRFSFDGALLETLRFKNPEAARARNPRKETP